jgi:hypothetical protein
MKNTTFTQWLICALGLWLLSQQCGRCFYDPGPQRWLNRDPLLDPGFETLRTSQAVQSPRPAEAVYDANLFRMLNNSPLNLTDALGLDPWPGYPAGPWGPGVGLTCPPPPPKKPPCHVNWLCTLAPGGAVAGPLPGTRNTCFYTCVFGGDNPPGCSGYSSRTSSTQTLKLYGPCPTSPVIGRDL